MSRRLAATIIALALVGLATTPPAQAARIKRIDPSPFALAPAGSEKPVARVLDRLGRRAGRASLARVLARPNHSALPLARAPVAGVAGGFRWTASDQASPDWYPQGITTLQRHGRARGLIVSWYSRTGKGARVSFISSRGGRVRYRHVLLVESVRRHVERVQTHAGGIAAVGSYLYVADTFGGLRVFHLGRMMRARGQHRRLGYRYVLPQVQRYVQPARATRFSFVSVDRSTAPASLVTGEYLHSKTGGKLLRWTLDARGRIVPGLAQEAFSSPAGSMQGALGLGGRLFIASSRGQRPGTLTYGAPGRTVRSRAWVIGAEALAYSPVDGLMYSLSEHPGQRSVFAIVPPAG